MKRVLLLTLLTSLVLVGLSPPARANTVFVTETGNTLTTVNWDLFLDQGSSLFNGDYVTIYDCGDCTLVGSSAPVNWTITTALVGVTPATTAPVDKPLIPNFTFTWGGGTEAACTSCGGLDLGTVTIASSVAVDLAQENYTASDHRTSDNTAQANIGTTEVPQVPAGVPESSTLLMVGSAGIAFGLLRFRNRRLSA
jgi:hypothetical protein